MNLIYTNSVGEAIQPLIHERISTITHLFPGWVQDVIVIYTELNEKNSSAAVEVFHQYRYVNLHIYPSFLSDIFWEETLLHELVHIVNTPYTQVVEDILENFVDSNFQAYVKQQLLLSEEAVSQDMARLMSLLTSGEKDDIIEE